MSLLDLLFTIVREEFRKLREKDPNLDGREIYQKIKNELSLLDKFTASSWKVQMSEKIAKKILALEEDENSKLHIHFLRQQVRIPHEESPNIRRIIQIAVNIGQFMATNDRLKRQVFDSISEPGVDLYELSDFISKKDEDNLSKHLDTELVKTIYMYLSWI